MVAVIEFFVGLIEVFSKWQKWFPCLYVYSAIFLPAVTYCYWLTDCRLWRVYYSFAFYGFEIIVGVVQATVFSMLTLVYLTIATTPIADHGHDEHKTATTADEASVV